MLTRTYFWLDNVKNLLANEFCNECCKILQRKLDEVDFEGIYPILHSQDCVSFVLSHLFTRFTNHDIDFILDDISTRNYPYKTFSWALDSIKLFLFNNNFKKLLSLVDFSSISITDFSERGQKVLSAIAGINSLVAFLGSDEKNKIVEKILFNDNGELLRKLLTTIMGES